MPTPEQETAAFASALSFDDLPEPAIDTVTRAFVDTIGVTLAGSTADAGRKAAESVGIGSEEASLAERLGVGTKSATDAAFRIGTAGHALDYDDMSWTMDGHPSVTLVPTLLSLADGADTNGRKLIAAYAAGFETACAIAGPITPDHYEAGWHATATLGTFGATAAAANLLGFDAEATARALNAAASMPAGLKRNFGSMMKPAHAGLCARSGVTAAQLTSGGFTTDEAAISGQRGFWELYGEGETGGFEIGDEFRLETDGIDTKAYPCCHLTHAAVAAAQSLTEASVDPSAVERVDVTASRAAADALRYPSPDTPTQSKFSMEHAVACALVRERVGLSEFEEAAIHDPEVRSMRERVSFEADPDRPYDSHGATVRITMPSDTYERQRERPPGAHPDPLTETELRAKFEECAGAVLAPDRVAELYDILSSLPDREDPLAAVAAV